MDITYKATHNPFSSSRMFTRYQVVVGDTVVGTVVRSGRGWWVNSLGTVKPPVRSFPTRKAAAEWLAAASGLWLVKP